MLLTSGQAARQLHIHPETLRRWEGDGLIIAQRTTGGHRRYQASDIAQLQRQMNTRNGNEQPEAWKAQLTLTVSFAGSNAQIDVERTLEPVSDLRRHLASNFYQDFLANGHWHTANQPAYLAIPARNQDLALIVSMQAYDREHTVAQQWLGDNEHRLRQQLIGMQPCYGVIGFTGPASLPEFEWFAV